MRYAQHGAGRASYFVTMAYLAAVKELGSAEGWQAIVDEDESNDIEDPLFGKVTVRG